MASLRSWTSLRMKAASTWAPLVQELVGVALLAVEGADAVAGMAVAGVEVLLRVEMVREEVVEGMPLLSEKEEKDE